MLYDPYDRPIRRLPRGVDVFYYWPQIESLTKWDVPLAKAHAQAHESGDLTISAHLYWALLTDPVVRDAAEKRALALRMVGYEVLPGRGPYAALVAARFKDALPHLRSAEDAGEMHTTALLQGPAPAQVEWELQEQGYNPAVPSGRGWYVPRLDPWPQHLVRWLPDGKGQLYALTSGSQLDAAPSQVPIKSGTGQWATYFLGSRQRPHLYGRQRSIWRSWISRVMDYLQWLSFNEIHGRPIRGVEIPNGMRRTQEGKQFLEDVRNMGRNGVLQLPQRNKEEGMKMTLIEAKSESWKSLDGNADRHSQEIRIALTGGLAHTEAEGGNYMSSKGMIEVRHEVKAADAVADAEMINTDIAPAFAEFNGYPRDSAPIVVPMIQPPVDRTAEAKAAQEELKAVQEGCRAHAELLRRGVQVDLVELLRARGVRLPQVTIIPPEPAPVRAPAPA